MGSLMSCSPPSAVDTYKCATPLQNPRMQDVFQTIIMHRKNWETLHVSEVVWPPNVEAVLIEGLENYQPDDLRETSPFFRFPMRNCFISDWIFEKTGKRRTAKQVGSRLQQLRDTCGGKRLLNLLSPIRRPSIKSDLDNNSSPSDAPVFSGRRDSDYDDNSSPSGTSNFEGARDSDFDDHSSPAHASMFAGAHGIVVSGGNFIIDQRTTTTQTLGMQSILPYSLLVIQSAITANKNPLNAPVQVESKRLPFELSVPYHSSSFDPYNDVSVLFMPLVFWYLWRMMFLHPSLPNM